MNYVAIRKKLEELYEKRKKLIKAEKTDADELDKVELAIVALEEKASKYENTARDILAEMGSF